MSKVKLNQTEQQKLLFLEALKNSMIKFNVSKLTIVLEDKLNYCDLMIENLHFNDDKMPNLEENESNDVLQFSTIMMCDFKKNELLFKIKNQIKRSLFTFDKTKYIKNVLACPRASKKTFTIALNNSELGIDFSQLDINLMQKMEKINPRFVYQSSIKYN